MLTLHHHQPSFRSETKVSLHFEDKKYCHVELIWLKDNEMGQKNVCPKFQ